MNQMDYGNLEGHQYFTIFGDIVFIQTFHAIASIKLLLNSSITKTPTVSDLRGRPNISELYLHTHDVDC